MAAPATVAETSLSGLTLVRRGKVRDVYAVDDARLLVKLVVAQKPGDLLSRVFPRRKALPALDIRHQSVEVRF